MSVTGSRIATSKADVHFHTGPLAADWPDGSDRPKIEIPVTDATHPAGSGSDDFPSLTASETLNGSGPAACGSFRAIAVISTAASLPDSARGASCMHVHLPKPLHSWREFIGEVGIIVVGVLIALTAEQFVENWHWHHKLEQTTDELDAELHNDAVSAYDWLTVAPCIDQQLSSLDAALAAARQSGRVEATRPLTPPLEIFTEDAWLNARAMQVADHLPRDTVARYTKLFFLPRDLAGTVVELHKEASELRSLSDGSSPISSEEVGADQRQAGRVRELLDRVELGDTLLLSQLDKIGIRPSPGERRRLLNVNRAWAGACAAPPNMERRFAPGDVS